MILHWFPLNFPFYPTTQPIPPLLTTPSPFETSIVTSLHILPQLSTTHHIPYSRISYIVITQSLFRSFPSVALASLLSRVTYQQKNNQRYPQRRSHLYRANICGKIFVVVSVSCCSAFSVDKLRQ
ncbi:hypothetical protein CLIB1423_07S02432 [[Candida] railenensis]|uniref:Uncharacterized protein n=1 Tax=[Candida] railenensis TaxID=45579 RepID=A0A9P0QNM5_9ASCO|nr:hypothetical protein CLIB1423_07S02432 [[Candida] railenensis]